MPAMKNQSVHELFSARAEEQGQATAIDRVVRRATYGELEAAANQVAHRLLARGVEKNSMVGVVAEDPIEIVTGILGVLKAGGVFVPLDPSFPEKRLQVMVEQVRPEWYVVEAKFQSKLQSIRCGMEAQEVVVDGEERKQADDRPPRVERMGDEA
jgi:non-ribosomal peptide synthetase component F